MTRSIRTALALVLALALASPSVQACCDDFWSCAGAVATGGLTCAIELALNSLRALIATVRETRTATSQEYLGGLQATTDEMKLELARLDVEIKAAMHEIDKAREEADKIVREDADTIRARLDAAKLHGTVSQGSKVKSSTALKEAAVSQNTGVRAANAVAPTPTKPPGGPASALSAGSAVTKAEISALTALSTDESLQTLRHRIEQLKKRKEALIAAIVKTESQMLGLQLKAAEAAQSSFARAFLKPIDDLLASLTATLNNPLNAPSVVSSGIAFLDGALNGFHTESDPLAEAAARAAELAVAKKIPPAEEMRKIADEAKKTLAAMRKAAAYRVSFDRQTVVKGLGAFPGFTPSAASQVLRLKASSSLSATTKRCYSKIGALKPRVHKLSEVKRTLDVSSFRPRLAGDFDGFFRGKSPADAKKKRDELLLEARRRFASDPKTLAAVEKLLTDEARARGVS